MTHYVVRVNHNMGIIVKILGVYSDYNDAVECVQRHTQEKPTIEAWEGENHKHV